ncbi:MAG: TCR/Tet family MFS transporter [Desulfobacteraceae bacterium]|nr:TCR/Tet family MFS transporter [Desulfobacteraceae bacterium]
MNITKFSLMLVITLDIMGRGLIIPVLTTLLMEQDSGFLKPSTSVAHRQFYYGVAMGLFFLSWFLGASYISKLSDFIGRKQGLLICLGGGLMAYLLTIISFYLHSLALLLLARIITGFTSGNQPIAIAALMDMGTDDKAKAKAKAQNMGLVMVGTSLGLMLGPMLGGVLSDKAIIGTIASLELPFYVACVLIIFNFLLILFTFTNVNFKRRPVTIGVTDVFINLWAIRKHPAVIKLSLVFFFSQITFNSFYIFADSYLFSRFKFDTMQNSIILILSGAAMALTGAFLVSPLLTRFKSKTVVLTTLLIMLSGVVVFMLNPIPVLSYVLLIPIVVAFAVNYPQMITLFSLSVDNSQQGWVMGISVAIFTLGAAIISFVEGQLMAVDINMPFIVAIGAGITAIILVVFLWRGKAME